MQMTLATAQTRYKHPIGRVTSVLSTSLQALLLANSAGTANLTIVHTEKVALAMEY